MPAVLQIKVNVVSAVLFAAIQHHAELEQNILQLRTSMQQSAQNHQVEHDRLVRLLLWYLQKLYKIKHYACN